MSQPSDSYPLLRRASIFITTDDIVRILALPAGLRILAIQGSFDPPGIQLIVYGDELPLVPIDSEAPRLAGGAINRILEVFTPRRGGPARTVTTWEWQHEQ